METKLQEFRTGTRRFLNSDLVYSFRQSKITIMAAVVTFVLISAAVCAPLLSTHNPFDPLSYDLMDAEVPPMWMEEGDPRFPLG